MPDAFELPRMLGTVVPQVGAHDALVHELIALALGHALRTHGRPATRGIPCFATVIRALNDLSEPAAALRCIQAIWVNRRTLHMINLPTSKLEIADIPFFALAIRSQDERALLCANQNTYFAHRFLPRLSCLNHTEPKSFGNPAFQGIRLVPGPQYQSLPPPDDLAIFFRETKKVSRLGWRMANQLEDFRPVLGRRAGGFKIPVQIRLLERL